MTAIATLVFSLGLISCNLSASGKALPIRSIIGPDGRQCATLLDGDLATGIRVEPGTYILRRDSDEPLVFVACHVSAENDGSLTVKCDDLMALPLAYKAGTGWHRLRIPYSRARTVRITCDQAGAVWNEVKLLGRTPLPAPTTARRKRRVTVNLADASDRPCCRIPAGAMTSWFERGLVDGLTRPATRRELSDRVREFPIKAIRYPGGTATYGYPPYRKAIATFIKERMGQYAYGLWWMERYGWASPGDFFRFCKDAGIIAWYELNPGFWYDPATDTIHKTIAMDARGDDYKGNYIPQAVGEAMKLAQLAKRAGVEVVWEIGNEDYSYYTGATYAKLCAAFIKGIRTVDPEAKFAVCGDSNSWSDWTFADEFVNALHKEGVTRLDYSSQHLYLKGVWQPAGGGWKPLPWETPEQMGQSAAQAWGLIRDLFLRGPKRFHDAGIEGAKLAITEFNIGTSFASPQLEHSVGRALGEAEALCGMLRDADAVFFHDLVRNGPESTFFARLDYYPDNPSGKRYFWFPEAAAAQIVVPHGNGTIAYNTDGICISRHPGFIYVTVVNRSDRRQNVRITLRGAAVDTDKPVDVHRFRAASLDCSFFDYYTERKRIGPMAGSRIVRVESVPCSVTGVKVCLR